MSRRAHGIRGAGALLAAALSVGGCSGCEEPDPTGSVTEAEPFAAESPEGFAEPDERGPAATVRPLAERAPGPGRGALRSERAGSASGLDDARPEARIEAIEEIDPEGAGLRELARLLQSDPDPEVRAAAAEQLESSDSPEAVQSLLGALADPEPSVVIAVLEALEFVGDESTVAHLHAWRNHPDPEVREAVEDAIEFLE